MFSVVRSLQNSCKKLRETNVSLQWRRAKEETHVSLLLRQANEKTTRSLRVIYDTSSGQRLQSQGEDAAKEPS